MDHIISKNSKNTVKPVKIQALEWEKIFVIYTEVYRNFICLFFIIYIYDRVRVTIKKIQQTLGQTLPQQECAQWPIHITRHHSASLVQSNMQNKKPDRQHLMHTQQEG